MCKQKYYNDGLAQESLVFFNSVLQLLEVSPKRETVNTGLLMSTLKWEWRGTL